MFVVGTGRCGSVSFAVACQHITNFTAAHETDNYELVYPDDHIEVNAMLRAPMAVLMDRYPNARWVHLIRERSACVPSLEALAHGEVVRCYGRINRTTIPEDHRAEAEAYYDYENAAIAAMLERRESMTFRLENRFQDWKRFWSWIGAEGNLKASLYSWSFKRNTRQQRGEE